MGFGINLPILLSQVVNFIILLGLLYLVAYKPIMRIFDERSKRIKQSLKQTEDVKAQMAGVEEDIKKRLEAASNEEREIIAKANGAAEEIRQRTREQANQEAESIVAQARLEIQSERNQAVDKMREDLANLIVLAVGKVIGQSLDKRAHLKLIYKLLEENATLIKRET